MKIENLPKIYLPQKESHKGQNGRLLVVGGSHLFHSASLWSLKVASRIVDLVHYSSVPENNRIVEKLTEEFRDGIIVPRGEIEGYIEEDDAILIGPGMVRTEILKTQSFKDTKTQSIKEIEKIEDEGVQTYFLTKYLLQKYPHKKWVIDAGALQMLELEWIPEGAILTPHHMEFEVLKSKIQNPKSKIQNLRESVSWFAKEYKVVVLLKGETDIIASSDKYEEVKGGNAGMTKGGTGDVLAGLVAGLAAKNDPFTAAYASSIINKSAGESLAEKVGYWFNASDLADEIPLTMKKLFL